MAFRFKLGESIEKGFRRIGLEQIDRATVQISGAEDPAKGVHELRKSMKRIRALLRLVRSGLGDTVFKAENARYRDIASGVAGARARPARHAGDAGQAHRPARRPARRGGQAAAQGGDSQAAPFGGHRRPAQGPAAAGEVAPVLCRPGDREDRARAPLRRPGDDPAQGPQDLPPGLPRGKRRCLPRLAQEGSGALAAHGLAVALLARGLDGARHGSQGAVPAAGRGPRLRRAAGLCPPAAGTGCSIHATWPY